MSSNPNPNPNPNAQHFILLVSILVLLYPIHSSSDTMSDLAKSLVGVPLDWKPGSNPCKWSSVECSDGQVVTINLVAKTIRGTLPSSLSELSSLQSLSLQSNSIGGPIPSVPPSIETVLLDGNQFTSMPPGFFSGLTALQQFSVDNNPLAPWNLSAEISQCTSLTEFSASNTSIGGTMPDVFGQLSSLQSLRLSYNYLTGGLPQSFAGSAIKSLWLNNQKSADRLTGPIHVIGAMDQLNVVWLQSNSFSGPIPDVSNLTGLTSFNVRDNSLTGVVPESLITSVTLNNVSIGNNRFQGQMPKFGDGVTADIGDSNSNSFCDDKGGPCDPRVDVMLAFAAGFGYPDTLTQTWTGNDPCSGPWDGVVCDAAGEKIILLNFANRKLVGTISPDVANLSSLTKLLLSNNNITGRIPSSLTGLKSLQLLDLSNNDLYGKVPEFDKSVVLKLSGNPNIGKDMSPGTTGGFGNWSGGGKAGVIVGVVISVIVIALFITGLVYYLKKQQQQQQQQQHNKNNMDFKPAMNKSDSVKVTIVDPSSGALSDSYNQGSCDNVSTIPIDALRKATEDFSESNIIGRGGFGVVYVGNLNGMPIAVKRNESKVVGKTGVAEFEAEVHVLQKTRHRHLVSFLGYCRDNSERLLVYEYMTEGTLGQHLFDRREGNYCPINWQQRLVIALDVARGIEYLHGLAQESFIHRDLKPSNILLDKDLRAKVSDFGLAKLADKEKSMHTRLAGTFGYLAPEYALTGKVSTKVDVYAYGVILMELITGRRALDESIPDEDGHLVMAFRRYLVNKDQFLNYVDPSLDLAPESHVSIFQVAELARHCTAREPNQRPSMGHPVQVLSPLVDHWVPSKSSSIEDDSRMSLTHALAKWQSDEDSFTTSFTVYKGDSSSTY